MQRRMEFPPGGELMSECLPYDDQIRTRASRFPMTMPAALDWFLHYCQPCVAAQLILTGHLYRGMSHFAPRPRLLVVAV